MIFKKFLFKRKGNEKDPWALANVDFFQKGKTFLQGDDDGFRFENDDDSGDHFFDSYPKLQGFKNTAPDTNLAQNIQPAQPVQNVRSFQSDRIEPFQNEFQNFDLNQTLWSVADGLRSGPQSRKAPDQPKINPPVFSKEQEFPNTTQKPEIPSLKISPKKSSQEECAVEDSTPERKVTEKLSSKKPKSIVLPYKTLVKIGVGILISLIIGICVSWRQNSVETGDIPVIEPPQTIKVRPSSKEASLVPYQDELIYGKLDGQKKQDLLEEHILPYTGVEEDDEEEDQFIKSEDEFGNEKTESLDPDKQGFVSEKLLPNEYLDYNLSKETAKDHAEKTTEGKSDSKDLISEKQSVQTIQPVKSAFVKSDSVKPSIKSTSIHPDSVNRTSVKPILSKPASVKPVSRAKSVASLRPKNVVPLGEFPTQDAARRRLQELRRIYRGRLFSIQARRRNGHYTYVVVSR